MTKNNQQIKADAKIAFENGNHTLAFQTLLELNNADEFISYVEKQDKRTKKTNWFAVSEYFWTDFILQQENFKELLSSESAIQLLHNYFKFYKKSVPEFELKLATEFPNLFIKAIRVNQVFFKPDKTEFLKSLTIGNDFKIHQKIWQKFYEIESQQWAEIQKELKNVLSLSVEDILSYCIIWIETNRFQDSDKIKINHLASVYSLFIELIISDKSRKHIQIKNSDEFFGHFLKVFTHTHQNEKLIVENIVSKLLFKISNWINFQETVVTPYSFDLNIEPKQENELISFNSNPESYYKWILNGVRYEVNQLNYLLQGSSIVEYLEETNQMLIPGKTEYDIQLNRNLAGTKYATLAMLSDLSCDYFNFYGKKINAQKVLEPLLTYSFNRLNRYEYPLQSFFDVSQNWSEAFMKLTMEGIRTDIIREPYFLMTECEYDELNKRGLSELPEVATKEVLQLFSWPPSNKYEFNRFNNTYEVWRTPFIKVDDFLFCPMMFFASNIWFYAFAQAALLLKTDPNDIQNMENHLASIFREKGWEVKVINQAESDEMTGDIDIFIEDENDLLFVQLKRTYFRLTLKDSYYEAINRDSKAAKQLNNAEIYLEQPNTIYQMKHKPHKWIVSNSFENIGYEIEGCKKINYFDLLNALKKQEIITLSHLIQDLEKDRTLKTLISTLFQDNLPFEAREIFAETLKPLTVFESKKYKQVIFSDDEKRTEEYNKLFNMAINFDKKGNKNEALAIIKSCIDLNPNDAEAHGAIANILADLRIYETSFIAFSQALKLLPNDPYITINYCIALMEAGYLYDGLLKAIELYQVFPMLGDIRLLFEKNFEQALKHKILDKKQILELKEKWDSLN